MSQGIVIVFMENEESHPDWASIGVVTTVQQVSVVVVVSGRYRTIECQKHQLSCELKK